MVWTVLSFIFAAMATVLLIKLHRLKKCNDEICAQLEYVLNNDTNNTIFLSVRSKSARKLATNLNKQLKSMREMHRRYLNGDRELKYTISAVSHDIRTPLTAMCGYLDLLSSENMSENAKRYLAIIENRAYEMKKLTDELFSYSVSHAEQKKLNLEKVNIKAVLEESLSAYYAVLNKRGITPCVQLCDKAVYETLDKTALARVFENIISNALKYSDGDLSVTLCENKSIIFENYAKELDNVEAGKLFNRFYTVDTAQISGGLGLAIAKTLTQRMGGEIFAEYKNDKLLIKLKF